jgi:electron transport complex protein RnfG
MGEMIKMVVVLTLLSTASGGLLAFFKDFTKDKIEYQQLQNIKGPAIRAILASTDNDPIIDRFTIDDSGIQRQFFVGVIKGKAHLIAFESSGKGYGGDIGLMVGVDTDTDKIVGVGVTTHSETPGLGSRAKTDPEFTAQFGEKQIAGEFKVKTDGGQIDAISGATVTSRGVAVGLTQAGSIYQNLKPQIVEKIKAFNK